MVALRREVLRWPLGLEFDAGELAAEALQRHLAVRVDGVLAGTLLVAPPPAAAGEGKLRQMAVAPAWSGRGLGRMLLDAGERELRRLGAASGRLHARRTAEGFYARHGWKAEGDGFSEVGVPHVLMRKRLRD
ncbi:MAG: GNAT family N-acetyltransferase [Gluconacetobacter diazotrophicus]|nr:GNAT family N-acetyltransferase [Gluconacetobacter diazotrophicus]